MATKEQMAQAEKYVMDHRLAIQNSDGNWVIFDVPIFAEVEKDGIVYDDQWLNDAVKLAQERFDHDRYMPPLHEEHNALQPSEEKIVRKGLGSFLPKQVEKRTVGGKQKYVVIADILVSPDVFEQIEKGRYPYLSIETGQNPLKPEISSMAALTSRAPEIKQSPLMVMPVHFSEGAYQFAADPRIEMLRSQASKFNDELILARKKAEKYRTLTDMRDVPLNTSLSLYREADKTFKEWESIAKEADFFFKKIESLSKSDPKLGSEYQRYSMQEKPEVIASTNYRLLEIYKKRAEEAKKINEQRKSDNEAFKKNVATTRDQKQKELEVKKVEAGKINEQRRSDNEIFKENISLKQDLNPLLDSIRKDIKGIIDSAPTKKSETYQKASTFLQSIPQRFAEEPNSKQQFNLSDYLPGAFIQKPFEWLARQVGANPNSQWEDENFSERKESMNQQQFGISDIINKIKSNWSGIKAKLLGNPKWKGFIDAIDHAAKDGTLEPASLASTLAHWMPHLQEISHMLFAEDDDPNNKQNFGFLDSAKSLIAAAKTPVNLPSVKNQLNGWVNRFKTAERESDFDLKMEIEDFRKWLRESEVPEKFLENTVVSPYLSMRIFSEDKEGRPLGHFDSIGDMARQIATRKRDAEEKIKQIDKQREELERNRKRFTDESYRKKANDLQQQKLSAMRTIQNFTFSEGSNQMSDLLFSEGGTDMGKGQFGIGDFLRKKDEASKANAKTFVNQMLVRRAEQQGVPSDVSELAVQLAVGPEKGTPEWDEIFGKFKALPQDKKQKIISYLEAKKYSEDGDSDDKKDQMSDGEGSSPIDQITKLLPTASNEQLSKILEILQENAIKMAAEDPVQAPIMQFAESRGAKTVLEKMALGLEIMNMRLGTIESEKQFNNAMQFAESRLENASQKNAIKQHLAQKKDPKLIKELAEFAEKFVGRDPVIPHEDLRDTPIKPPEIAELEAMFPGQEQLVHQFAESYERSMKTLPLKDFVRVNVKNYRPEWAARIK